MHDLPGGFKEALQTVTRVQVGFLDRLKLLIGYSLQIETCTYLEFTIEKRQQAETRTLFLRPEWFPKPKPCGYVLQEKPSGENKTTASDTPAGN
jgi:hypothetical protein